MTIEINAVVITGFLMTLGVPSMLITILFRRMEKRMDERETVKQRSQVLVVQGVKASISLGEACAISLRDGKTNGEIKCALDYAKKVKHEMDDLYTAQAIERLR